MSAAVALLLTATPAAEVRVVRDVTYAARESGELKLDLYLPAEVTAPPVLYIHGGGWSRGDKADGRNALFLAEAGRPVASVQYRLSPAARFPAQLNDCFAAALWLRVNAPRYGFEAERYGVVGESAGGHLAALLALTGDPARRPSAVVQLFCPTDLTRHVRQTRRPGRQPSQSVQQLVGGDPTADPSARKLADRASPITHVGPDAPPFLLVHGTADDLVDTDQTARFAEALRKAGNDVEIAWVPGAGHAGPAFWGPDMQARYATFLDRHLPAP